MKPLKSMTSYAALVNAVHIALCALIYIARITGIYEPTVVKAIFFVAEIIIWFVFGIVFALGTNNTESKKSLLYAFLSIVPIMLVTAVCFLVSEVTDQTGAQWAQFFFLGSAVNFFNRPAAVLSLVITQSAYIIYAVNIVMMFVLSLLGSALASGKSKASRNRRKRKKIKSVRKRSAAADKKEFASTEEEKEEPSDSADESGEDSETPETPEAPEEI